MLQTELSDVDRGVDESLDLRIARHPSESSKKAGIASLVLASLVEKGEGENGDLELLRGSLKGIEK